MLPDQAVRPRFPWPATVAAAWLLAVDSIRSIQAGPVTLSGIATVVVFSLLLLQSAQLLLARSRPDPYRKPLSLPQEPLLPRTGEATLPIWATLTLAYMLFRLVGSPTSEAVQNVAVYSMFLLSAGIVADSVSAGSARRVSAVMLRMGIAATVIALVAFTGTDAFVYGARSYSLAAIPIIALAIPERSGGWLIRWSPYLVIAAVAASLSRTALFVVVGLMVFRVVRKAPGARSWKALVAIAAAGYALYYAVTEIPSIRDRFTEGDNATLLGVNVNTSGRTALWDVTWQSAQTHLWFGQGPGTAAELILRVYPPTAHPHSDWLRLVHDFGLVGAGLFLIAFLTLLLRVLRKARATDETIHWSAVIALLGVAAAAVTDNVLTYPFVMLPVGVIVGLSLSAPPPVQQPVREFSATSDRSAR